MPERATWGCQHHRVQLNHNTRVFRISRHVRLFLLRSFLRQARAHSECPRRNGRTPPAHRVLALCRSKCATTSKCTTSSILTPSPRRTSCRRIETRHPRAEILARRINCGPGAEHLVTRAAGFLGETLCLLKMGTINRIPERTTNSQGAASHIGAARMQELHRGRYHHHTTSAPVARGSHHHTTPHQTPGDVRRREPELIRTEAGMRERRHTRL